MGLSAPLPKGWLTDLVGRDVTDEWYKTLCAHRKELTTKADANVEAVRAKLSHRAAIGLDKYGVTTERQDVDLLGWCQHLQEELLDGAVYLEAAMAKLKTP